MDGSWRGRKLFSCREKRGLIVPAAGLLPVHRRPSGHQSVTEECRRTPKERRRGQRAGAGAAFLDKEADGAEELVGQKDADSRTERTLEGRLGGRSEECGLRKEGAASWMVEDQDVEVLLRRRRLNRSVGEGLDCGSNRDSFHSGRSSRNRHSGLFGLLKWFKKERSEEDSWEPGSPVLARTSLSGSVDTLFSTASSFAFVKPQQFRQYGLSSQPRARLFASETNTFRNRICERERLRRIDNNVSLREKYGLYECGTLPRSVDHIDEISVEIKKRRAPPPPETRHRRTLSEPVKVHVKGKRKAPPPPGFEDIISISTSNSNSSKRSRKKRRAPSPPKKVESGYANGIANDDTISNASTVDIGSLDVVCTDTLKLERGVLKPNMEKTYAEPKVCPSSPVSPRPWYKRTASRDTNSKDRKKERDRRKVEDWMLESGIPRKSLLNNENRLNIFTKLDKTEDKRRSQISILTNISELDREAAEIIKRGKDREKNLMESHNAKFYNESGNALAGENGAVNTSTPQNTQRSSARDLLSLLNAITNVTRAAVNASLVEQEKQQTTQNKFQVPKDQAIKVESYDEVVYKLYPKKEEEPRPSSSSAASSSSTGKIARVTIEELEEFDAERNSKAQAIFEANKQNRQQQQPAIPSIAEVTEKTPKTTPESTLAETKGSAPVNQPKPSQVPHMKNLNVWVCPRCTLENLRWRITCEACDMWRPNPFELRERTFKDQNNESDKKEIEKEKPNFITKLNPSNIESKPSTKSIFAKTELPESKIEKKEAISVPTTQTVVTPKHTPTNERMNSKSETKIVNSLALIGTNTGNVKPQTVETKNKDCASALPLSSQNEKIIEIKIEERKDLNKGAVANDEVSRKVEIKEEGSRDSSPDSKTDEVRKARLAFFTKNQASCAENKESNRTYDTVTSEPMKKDETKKEEVEQKPNGPEEEPKRPSVKIYREDSEKQKLKDMLIEMKHSLPKRGSRKSQGQTLNDNTDEKAPQEAQKPKVPENSLKQTIDSNKGFAEAYLVESQTIIEEIKYKKPSEKVSSAAQTSGLVTQLAPTVAPSSGKELVIPVKVEEHTIKDGVLYTSTSKGVKKIGSGTFQLLRARDFADIKNVKGGKEVPLPVYANVAEDGKQIEEISKQLVAPQGVAIFRAGLDTPEDKNLNTMAVNRLLKRLEVAIAGGNHELAAALARELAQLKVSCSVVRQKPNLNRNEILVELYVEDKTSHQGPFHLKLTPNMTVGELRDLVQAEYEIPTEVQRWILANKLASDDKATLGELGVAEGTPIFLYLVAPEQPVKTEPVSDEAKPSTSGVTSGKQKVVVDQKEATPPKNEIHDPIPVPGPSGVKVTKTEEEKVLHTEKAEKPPTVTSETGWRCDACTLVNSSTGKECAACGALKPNPQDLAENKVPEATKVNLHKPSKVEEEKGKNYQKLIDLEKDDLIIYTDEFECPVCLVEYPPMEGILLRECLHVFCRNCLAHTVHFSDEAEVKCPFRDDNYTCDSTLLEREIKAIVTPQAYEEHLAKSIALAETKIGNTFHCKTPDCKGWCIYEDNVNIFKCPVCTHSNCLTCQAIHEGLNCKQYQEQLNSNAEMSVDVKRTKEMLQEMVSRGEAMNCPTCQVVLMKKWGCDWLRCSMCKTEICWITRGPRWGPNGKGDTSGGCQCGVNGVKCHPKCTYCH